MTVAVGYYVAMRVSPLVLIGLGSNLPWQKKSSVAVVVDALQTLQTFASDRFVMSSLYRTSPVDCPADSTEFINAAAAFTPRTGLTAEVLLAELKDLERAYGRGKAIIRNAPRVLDLDVLAFGDLVLDSPDFILPHPRATQRAFVMIPLNEIAPDFLWPGTAMTVADLCMNLDSDEHVARIV
jgi:2-amino-4-hydroxy-6-hydroxymethyldihydropteridine diphosphokinase